jgi:hypothetical protein
MRFSCCVLLSCGSVGSFICRSGLALTVMATAGRDLSVMFPRRNLFSHTESPPLLITGRSGDPSGACCHVSYMLPVPSLIQFCPNEKGTVRRAFRTSRSYAAACVLHLVKETRSRTCSRSYEMTR